MAHNPGNFNTTSPISYPSQCGPTTALSPPSNLSGSQLGVGEVILVNRSGVAADVGFGWKQPNALWEAGQIDVSATPDFIDDTTDAQDAGTDDFALFTTTNDDGFLVRSTHKFNVIGMTVGTAEAGTPTYVYEYYNGTAMATLPTYSTPAAFTAADHIISFPAPHDWATGSTAAVSTDSAGKYVIQVTASTAPTTAPLANVLWVTTLFDYFPLLADDAALNFEMSTEVVVPAAASIVPYFGTAATGNTIQVHWRPLGGTPS